MLNHGRVKFSLTLVICPITHAFTKLPMIVTKDVCSDPSHANLNQLPAIISQSLRIIDNKEENPNRDILT